MKYYVEFLEPAFSWNGREYIQLDRLTSIGGSDSIFILDGRKRLDNLIADARDRIKQLNNVQPHICGFTINKGNLRQSTVIYREEGIR